MKRQTLLFLCCSIPSYVLSSQTLAHLPVSTVVEEYPEYKVPEVKTLEHAAAEFLLNKLLENSDESVQLFNTLPSEPLRQKISEILLKRYLVFFLDLFKPQLLCCRVPETNVIAGGFCQNPEQLIILGIRDGNYFLSLWDTNDLIYDPTAEIPDKIQPRAEIRCTLTDTRNRISPDILKTSLGSTTFIINDRRRHTIQVWRTLSIDPYLEYVKSITTTNSHEISLSKDGSHISLSHLEPLCRKVSASTCQKPHKESREQGINEEVVTEGLSAPSCFSGDGKVLLTLSPEGKLISWNITGDKPVPLTLFSESHDRAEALDHTGRYMITSQKRSKAFRLWDCHTFKAATFFERTSGASPVAFDPHEPVGISSDNHFVTFSLANEAPCIADLITGKSVALPIPATTEITPQEINYIQLNTTNCLLLYLINNKAYLYPTHYPMQLLSLAQRILLVKINIHGAAIRSQGYYRTVFNSLPDDLRHHVATYFSLNEQMESKT